MSWIPPVIAAWEKLSSSSKVLSWLYARPYRGVLENEISLARIDDNDIVLNVGCGAVPFSALYVAALAGARVYAVDIDPEAVRLARRCVAKTGLSHKITVLEKNGAEQFEHPFTVALIALQAAPKEKILKALKKKALPGGRFIFRLPSFPYRDHYDGLAPAPPALATALQPMRTFDRSVLYVNPS